MSDRISLDHPTIPYLEVMPTYYVGQQVINDGPDEVWEFAMAQAETGAIHRFYQTVVEHLPSSIGATVESGDSPGADSNIQIPIVPGDSQTPYIGVYPSEETRNGHAIYLIESSGENTPMAELPTCEAWVLADAIEAVYRVIREPIDKINAMPED